MHSWLVLGHVLASFAFVFAHGTSAFVIVRLRRDHDPDHVRLLLDLSMGSLRVANISGLALIILGIWAGIDGGWWTGGQLWIWVALAVLVAVIAAMYLLISRHTYGWRAALASEPPPTATELAPLLSTPQPLYGSAIGIAGLAVIIWLMTLKPF